MRFPSVVGLVLCCLIQAASAATILITPGSGLSSNADALAAFQRAASAWSAVLADPVQININADLANLGSTTIIGQTSSVILSGGFNTIRSAMVTDASFKSDAGIVASLPTAAEFTALVPGGVAVSSNILVTKANAKALGFTNLDVTFGSSDASMTFNSQFSFDYDNTNGVSGSLIDFQTVATHEIGHALGFFSSVDSIDGGATSVALSALDLFRFSLPPIDANQFRTAPRDLRPGGSPVFSDTVNSWAMSTGLTQGDGRQASHWKDDGLTGVSIGVMDPTLRTGVISLMTPADLRAMELIGWDVVAAPEPGTLSFLLAGGGALVWVRRRRSGRT